MIIKKQKYKKIKTIIYTLLISFGCNFNSAKADSPLTSANLVAGYEDLPIMMKLQEQKKMDHQVLNFLLSKAPLDQKAAVINALGWNIDGQNNADLYLQALHRYKRMSSLKQLTVKDLTPEEKFVFGYLFAMDNYFHLSSLQLNNNQSVLGVTPLEIISQSAFALPDNFTVQFVKSLVEAQLHFSNSWCAIYLSPTEVLQRFPSHKRNLHPDAVAQAMEYINLYQDNCY